MGKKIDLTGQVFGKLTVLKEGERKNGKLYWTCQCECGNTISVSTTDFKDGHIKSCGCKTHEIQQKNKMKDIQNKRFGKLIALEPDFEKSKNSHGIVWLCKCDCGNNAYVKATQLLQGKTKSCGCLLKEVLTERNIIEKYKLEKNMGSY